MPLPRQFTQLVNGSECIGDSLHNKINPNFDNLDTATQQLSTSIQTLSSFTYALSSSTINSFTNVNTNNATTLSLLTSLSSYIIPRATKAWVKFDGTPASIVIEGSATISSSFNVLSVARIAAGLYRVQFNTWFTDNKYAITTSASTSGVYTFTLNPSPSTVEVYSNTFTTQPTAVDAVVSVIVNSY